jgi:hypothetical protein
MDDLADPILQFFSTEHLPAELARVSRPFGELATSIAVTYPPSEQRTIGLQKLLEAKDAIVRAVIFKRPGG